RKVKAGLRGGAFYGRWLPTLMVGKGQIAGGYARFGALAKHVRYVERASRRMARETFYGMARWRGKMERKQAFLGRMVDIGAELFAMSASSPSACSTAATNSSKAAFSRHRLMESGWPLGSPGPARFRTSAAGSPSGRCELGDRRHLDA